MDIGLPEIGGTVISGKQLGRRLGFPTANIVPDDATCLPADGVYVAQLRVEDKALRAIVNQGAHPTFPEGGRTIEVHAIQDDVPFPLYGRRVRLRYLSWLRAERTFSDGAALANQIAQDRDAALAWFETSGTEGR